MKRLFLLFATALLVFSFSSGTYAWNQSTSGAWASFKFGDWTVYQNEWGAPDVYAELYANSASNWAAAGSWSGGGTKGYPHVQGNPNMRIGAGWMNASFDFSGPSGATYTLVFDCWTAGMQDEIMIEEAWGGSKGHWGSQIASNVNIGGRLYQSVWQANNGANPVYIFTPASQETSGTTDIMAVFVWARNNVPLHNDTLYEVSFGPEITSTNGWQQFTMNSFSANWGSGGNGGNAGSGGNGGNGVAMIQNRATGLYLDGMGRPSNGSNAGQWGYSGSRNQQWTLEPFGNNVRIKNVATGQYLDGMGDSSFGSRAGQWGNSGSTNQQWTIEDFGDYKRIRNVATGLYLDGMSWRFNGSDLGQWGDSGSDAQQWTITAH